MTAGCAPASSSHAAVLALLGFVLAAKPFEPDDLPPPALRGTTAQGRDIRLAPTRFAGRGPRLSATSKGHFREAGRPPVAMRGRLRGTVGARHASGTLEVPTARGSRGKCTAGLVRWSAD